MQNINLSYLGYNFYSSLSVIVLLMSLIAAVLVITIHELIKAMISHRLGDPLPKKDGRLSLNPLRHIEPIGLILMLVTGYGWGKPLNTAAVYYKDKKRDTLLTYGIPTIITLCLGIAMAVISGALHTYLTNVAVYMDNNNLVTAYFYVYQFTYRFASLSIAFAIFNIIPVYPLNGFKILNVFLSPNNVIKMASYEKIMQVVMILFILWGGMDRIVGPIVHIFL